MKIFSAFVGLHPLPPHPGQLITDAARNKAHEEEGCKNQPERISVDGGENHHMPVWTGLDWTGWVV